MIGFTDFLLLVLAISAAVFLLRHRRIHESADSLARQYCRHHRLQFLDGTVSSSGISLNWRKLQVCHSFRFDYSLDNTDRHFGMITLCGEHMQAFSVNPDHMRIQDSKAAGPSQEPLSSRQLH